MSTSTLVAPAVGTRYRKLATGRIWHIHRLCDSGLIGITDDQGDGAEIRDYITSEGLAASYRPAG